MLTDDIRREAADALAAAERDRKPIDPLTQRFPAIDVVDAYEIQLLQVRDKIAAGRRVRGHKVGLSSKAMQAMMNVDEPDYGHLLDDMFVYEGVGRRNDQADTGGRYHGLHLTVTIPEWASNGAAQP